MERLMPIMEKFVSNAVTDKTLVDILRWYRSPLGQKIAMAEVNTNAPDALDVFSSSPRRSNRIPQQRTGSN